jgi:hypothetical protein
MIHERQRSREELITELEAAGAVIRGNAIKCPFHDDHTPSGGAYQGKDGVWRYKCQSCGAGGDVYDIESRRTGKPLSEVLPKTAQGKPQSKNRMTPQRVIEQKPFCDLEAAYAYLLKKFGGHLEALHRYSEKQAMIRWRGADGEKKMRPICKVDGGYLMKAIERPLYHLSSVADAEIIVIVEGEGKADVLRRYGFPAITSMFGAQAAYKTDWTPLAVKDCIIWPDAGMAGKKYADDVRKILEGLGCQVKVIDPTELDLHDGEDAADFVKQLQTTGYDELRIKQAIMDALGKAKDAGSFCSLSRRMESIIDGSFASLPTGFIVLDKISPILPCSISAVCSTPGASKTLWLFQLAGRWIMQGFRVALYELEKDIEFHLLRILAQQSETAGITNTGWITSNPNLARELMAEHRPILDAFGKSITVSPLRPPTQEELLSWAEKKAKNGFKILIIDPVTLAGRDDDPHKADTEFVGGLLTIARDYHCYIFLIMHPAKAMITVPDMYLIAGGAVYSRAADNIFWLENHESKTSEIHSPCGTLEKEHNRTVWVLKSRDGCGTGARIAYNFSGDSLTLDEIGIVKKKKKK